MEHGAQFEVVPDVGLQAGGAVRPQDDPDFQSAETAAERDLPVAVIGYQARGGEIVTEVGWSDGEGGDEILALFDVEAAREGLDKGWFSAGFLVRGGWMSFGESHRTLHRNSQVDIYAC